MKIINIKCPNCNSQLKVEKNAEKVKCEYCKTEFLIDDEIERIEIHSSFTDEAEVKKWEIKNEISKRKEKKRIRDSIELWLLMFFMLLLGSGLLFDSQNGKETISMPESAKYYVGKDYERVVQELEDLGFENIDIKENPDLVIGFVSKENTVSSISIGGESNFKKDDWFYANDHVVITYHVFKE